MAEINAIQTSGNMYVAIKVSFFLQYISPLSAVNFHGNYFQRQAAGKASINLLNEFLNLFSMLRPPPGAW